MNFIDAVREMKLGKKVRRPYFQEDFYWHSFNKETIVNKRNEPVMASYFPELEAIDWEIYEEPKKTLWNKRYEDNETFSEFDVKEAIKEFMKELGIYECIVPQNLNTDKVLCALKRKFGKELLE